MPTQEKTESVATLRERLQPVRTAVITEYRGLTVQQLFDRTRASMPQHAPGSMTRPETADMFAYLLQQNRFPAGSAELKEDPNALAMIKYVATKP